MISYLEGQIISKNDKYAVVLASGVGYRVFLPSNVLHKIPEIGEIVKIFTYLHVKEDGMALYGFATPAELEFFELLITISGIGPKAALAIISLDKPNVLAGAILREDINFLTKISGIGAKTAQKIVLELKEKVTKLSFSVEDADAALDADPIEALVALGWSAREAREALRRVPREITQTESRVKEAMKLLGR